MRRILSPSFALLAGLATLLAGCAGETLPTERGGTGGAGTGGTGQCNVDIQLAASSFEPFAGTAVVIRATVKRNGAAVPDGTSVKFTTDFGFFLETGLATVSKVISSGVADVTLASTVDGPANVTATFECGTRSTRITFGLLPVNEPFISSVAPTQGKCEGGETVTIQGGNFDFEGNTAATTRVTFGGAPATIVSVTRDTIVVKTPARTVANPANPERVDISVTVNVGKPSTRTVNWTVAEHNGFTYNCLGAIMHITSLNPTSGTPDGGTVVTILGTNFGTNIATTRVTFGGVAASISAMTDTTITVSTPRHPLANPEVPETVDVTVTKDLGLPSQQSDTLFNAFTYRGGTTRCPANPLVFISSVKPLTGSPNGGEKVDIFGGGFGTVLGTTRVEFGGVPAQVTAVTDNQITVSTPRHPLANPNAPETVSVVVTKDVGGPNCTTATQANAFTYTNAGVLTLFSSSPVTGPNDVSTRVTVFGTGFVFPMQVFLTGGGCGSQQVEAAVIEIQPDHLVFQTPIAANGNQCLANGLVTIRVVNPTTGDKADLPDAFKYYACPTATAAVPEFGPYFQPTTVTITGQNFVEGAQATWTPTITTTAGPIQLQVSSVSAAAIVVTLPTIDPRNFDTTGTAAGVCSNLAGTIKLTFPSLSCINPVVSVPFTYTVSPPQITAASPNTLAQDGCPAGSFGCGTKQVITVAGANFQDPMTVVITKDGADLVYTQVNNSVVSNPFQLTFPAPAIRNADLNTQACTVGGAVTGTMYVPTSFGIRVKNARTGCTAELQNALIYIPNDQTCRATPTITAPSVLPQATLCTAYGGATTTVTAAGGTSPYTFSATGLPAGVTINPTSGLISGTPQLTVSGPGAAVTTYPVTVTVTDALGVTGSKSYSLVVLDPNGPFTVLGTTPDSIANGANGQPITTSTAGIAPITWTIVTTTPTPGSGSFTLTTASGASTAIHNTSVPTGTYTVTVRANDAGCGGTNHQNTMAFSVTVP